MSYGEMFKLISKAWSSVNDIMVIANCGRKNATTIRETIIKKIKDENKEIPYGKTKVVPTKRVIEYLDLDIDYIKDMAIKEQEVRNYKIEYASISK